MVQTFRPAFLTLALLVGAAPAFAQGSVTTTPVPAPSAQRPVATAPATPANPAGQVTTQRPATATPGTAQAPVRPAQPAGTAATTPAPTAPRTN